MKNLDTLQQKKTEILQRINQSVKDGNEEAFAQAFTEFTDILQEAVMAEARGLVQAADNTILQGRGVRALTSQETQYYQKVIEAMKSSNPQQALTLIDEALPSTVIDAIMEDITEAHPLLAEINFQNTGILTEILVSSLDGRFTAVWGKLCDEIVTELTSGLDVIDLTQNKLSAFIPVCKAMLEAGPAWIDRYVREILMESIANGLEGAIIDGSGLDQPVGMMRNPNGVLDPVTGYTSLVPVPLSRITPEEYGALIAGLAVGPNLLYRNVTEVLLICNPVDYFLKVMPAVMIQQPDGTWVSRFPFPTKVIQSVHVAQNKAIIGLGKRYFFGLGTSKGGKIDYSDHYRFLEDERVYLTKLYGDGKPLDSTSFKVLDISNLKPFTPVVRVADYVDARLSGIGLKNEKNQAVNYGAFDANVHVYYADIADAAVAGDNDTAALTVTTADPNAVVVVKNGSTAVNATGGVYSLTLTEGVNIITITVTVDGVETESYVLVITYTPEA